VSINGAQCHAARILVRWPRAHVARKSGLDEDLILDFEAGRTMPDADALARLRSVLEEGGAMFLFDDDIGGTGVRLKFTARDVRAINKWEGEGGPVGDDDVWPGPTL